jgi:hypothetical protein
VGLRKQVEVDEAKVKETTDNLAARQKEYADAQKALTQLATAIKDSQAKVEKLRAEVKSAIDANDWRRAFYKNYRLGQAIADANHLLEENGKGREKAILDQQARLEQEIGTAETAAANAKQKLDDDKTALKDAEKEYKDKLAGLETTIANSL